MSNLFREIIAVVLGLPMILFAGISIFLANAPKLIYEFIKHHCNSIMSKILLFIAVVVIGELLAEAVIGLLELSSYLYKTFHISTRKGILSLLLAAICALLLAGTYFGYESEVELNKERKDTASKKYIKDNK